ncbi:carbohydrate binding domain-containing protein [Puniceicoccus vermicola]|uniref:carbohydrate binding domain-containing protein n=1 Tax=Puniceicoccus vermicola TaxID=388746 RepID=UPI003394544A
MKFIGLSCAFGCAAVPVLGASENLLDNPGFEDLGDTSSWNENNWASLDADFLRDPVNPHSGSYSQKVTLKKVEGVSDLQFAQDVDLNPGDLVQVRFWSRGFSNSAPVSLQIRRKGHPYRQYFSAEFTATEAWSEHLFNVTMPSNFDAGDELVLLFSLGDETSIWLDDVSLSRISPQSDAPAFPGNPLRNDSFEVGIDGWVATFREAGGIAKASYGDENNISTSLDSVFQEEAPDGSRVMTFKVRDDCSVAITSGFFPLRYGHPVEVGFWMKTSVPGLAVEAALGGGTFPNMVWDKYMAKSDDKAWRYYRFTATPKPNAHGTYVLQFYTRVPGRYEIDQVTVMDAESTVSVDDLAPMEAGFEDVEDGDPAHIYHLEDQAAFRLNVLNRDGMELTARVIDLWDNVLAEFSVTDFESNGLIEQTVLSMPTTRLGGFKCSVYANGESEALAEVLYVVLPRLAAVADVEDSFFGGHAKLTPYNLHIAEKMGYRWLRLYPPLVTQWMAVEPEPGEWNFDTRGAARAHDMGFQLMAGFSSTPEWAAGVSPKLAARSRWWSSWPPAKWSDWQTYVKKTQEAFGPYIQTWEVWNEPDGKFLQVPGSQEKPVVYLDLLRTASEALSDVREQIQLIAGAVVTLHRPFTRDVLNLDAGQYIDAYSFHYYGGYVGERSPDETADLEEIEHIRSFKNRDGKPLNIWVTEAGVKAPSWLDTMHIAQKRQTTIAGYAHTLVRSAIFFKAVGAKRFFHYEGFANPSGSISYRRETAIVDVDGIPQPSVAAFAAMVYFLEGAEPLEFEIISLGEAEPRIAQFERGARKVSALWSRTPVGIQNLPELDLSRWDAFDLMGNPIEEIENIVLSLSPVYLVEKSQP